MMSGTLLCRVGFTRTTSTFAIILSMVFIGFLVVSAKADERMIEDFASNPETRWAFFTDQVMGGVSNGEASFAREANENYVRLRGKVSTENNGGFIQIRTKLESRIPRSAQGITLTVRGNGEEYLLHVRTPGTVLPWQYYQASFTTTPDWKEILIPFDSFKPSGRTFRASLRPQSARSIGVVAYGRDYDADVSVASVGFY